ncbi:MAG: DUF6868 family protein [Methylophagaceae bacterium]
MTIDLLREILGWCAVINYGLLMFWFLMFAQAHDWVYNLHGKWFTLSVERFDAIHYTGMAVFKFGIFMFNIVPYIALRIVT